MCEEIILDGYFLSRKKLPTRRGVIWLGQTCNLNCYFCYFAARIADKNHPEHPFFSLDKAKEICNIFKNEYELNSIDIQGGEPTIYPHIFELLDYCNAIGLKPTLITNAIVLHKYEYAKKFKEHGIYDFLISLQGIGDVYDKVVGLKGGFKKQLMALENLQKLDIPIRINAVLSKEIIQDLDQIVDLAIKYNARVVNFIGYNNTGDQKQIRKKEQIPFYKYISQKLMPLIDELEEKNIEVNLRFLPFCFFEEKYRKNIQNQKQKIFDLHEWEPSSRLWIDLPNQRRAHEKTDAIPNKIFSLMKRKIRKKDFKGLLRSFIYKSYPYRRNYSYQTKIAQHLKYYIPSIPFIKGYSKVEHFYFEMAEVFNDKIKSKKCEQCAIKNICDGVHSDYLENFGEEELNPIQFSENILDPLFYNKSQFKVIENQEKEWFCNE